MEPKVCKTLIIVDEAEFTGPTDFEKAWESLDLTKLQWESPGPIHYNFKLMIGFGGDPINDPEPDHIIIQANQANV